MLRNAFLRTLSATKYVFTHFVNGLLVIPQFFYNPTLPRGGGVTFSGGGGNVTEHFNYPLWK